jgi:hypothetical protein
MGSGVQLTLLIGPALPVPVARGVLEALTAVKVVSNAGDTASAFELTFGLNQRSPLHTLFLLSGGAAVPIMRVVLVATLNGSAEVLIDGVMTHHEVQPGADGRSSLFVKGTDLSALMDIVPFDGLPYPAMPPAVRVMTALAKYAAFGVVPMVIPGVLEDVPIPVERVPRQQGTDLAYIRHLAEEAGHVFYLEPGPAPGASVAYWGPEIKVGVPQPALSVDMDAHTNVESLSFSFDKESKELPIVFIQNQATRLPLPIPIPDITPLNPPLGMVPPLPPKLTPLRFTSKLSPLQAALHGLAYASRHADAVTGTGSLDVLRYGRILKARKLVGVRGAGPAFDGLHYVRSVTHTIERGQYKQSFSLSRNGLLPTVPTVAA